MFHLRYLEEEDREFWYTLDRHLPETEFIKKVADKRGYVILDEEKPIGILRFNIFWDNTPFLISQIRNGWFKQQNKYQVITS